MCNYFSLVYSDTGKIYSDDGLSHVDIFKKYGLPDDETNPSLIKYARVEVNEKKGTVEVDDDIIPDWWCEECERECLDYVKEHSTEKLKLNAVKKDSFHINRMANPSEEVQLEAVKMYGSAILHIDNPTEKVQREAVKTLGAEVNWINDPNQLVADIMERKSRLSKENGKEV